MIVFATDRNSNNEQRGEGKESQLRKYCGACWFLIGGVFLATSGQLTVALGRRLPSVFHKTLRAIITIILLAIYYLQRNGFVEAKKTHDVGTRS